jgi:multidrug efflux pump subunit AcrA (membrane-fusion protein)
MLTAAFPLAGCKKAQTVEAPGAPVVEVAEVIEQDVPVFSEWTASTDGYVNAAIRAQVQGYLVERDYKEGTFVRKGEVLFRIDPRTFQAALEQATGHLTEQRARWETAKANLERIKPLVAENAVSKKVSLRRILMMRSARSRRPVRPWRPLRRLSTRPGLTSGSRRSRRRSTASQGLLWRNWATS